MLLDTLAYMGRVDDMPHAHYLDVPAVSSSAFKAMRKSPLHFRMLTDQTIARPSKASTPQQFAGTLMHTALLEPLSFEHRFPIGPDAARNSKEWRNWAAMQDADAQPVTQAQADIARAQAESLRAVPHVAQLFARAGSNEVSVFWRDEATGLACKARPDRVIPTQAGAVIFDAKSAIDASRAGFARACANFYYHTQAAWYMRAWRAATGQDVAGFVFGVVESEFPYVANAYMLDDSAIEAADAECTRMLERIAQCERADTWPGYPDGMSEPLILPAWTFAEDRIA